MKQITNTKTKATFALIFLLFTNANANTFITDENKIKKLCDKELSCNGHNEYIFTKNKSEIKFAEHNLTNIISLVGIKEKKKQLEFIEKNYKGYTIFIVTNNLYIGKKEGFPSVAFMR